jgi:hypothetical protein
LCRLPPDELTTILLSSVAPSVHGEQDVKKGLLCQLFGGAYTAFCALFIILVVSDSNDCGGVIVIEDIVFLQITFSIFCAGLRNLHSQVEVDSEAN